MTHRRRNAAATAHSIQRRSTREAARRTAAETSRTWHSRSAPRAQRPTRGRTRSATARSRWHAKAGTTTHAKGQTAVTWWRGQPCGTWATESFLTCSSSCGPASNMVDGAHGTPGHRGTIHRPRGTDASTGLLVGRRKHGASYEHLARHRQVRYRLMAITHGLRRVWLNLAGCMANNQGLSAAGTLALYLGYEDRLDIQLQRRPDAVGQGWQGATT